MNIIQESHMPSAVNKICSIHTEKKNFWCPNKKNKQNKFWSYESEFWLSQLNFLVISTEYLIVLITL